MPLLMLKDLPRYECLLEAAREFPDLDPSATEVFLNLLRTGDEAFRAVEAHLAQHDITQGRFGVLMALWACDGAAESGATLSPAVLAERTGVTRATITGLVDMSGGRGNDRMAGTSGNNSLDGGAGSDTMVGGAGDDAYFTDVSTDVMTEGSNAGIDTVFSWVTRTLSSNLENLTLLGTSAINATGNAATFHVSRSQ